MKFRFNESKIDALAPKAVRYEVRDTVVRGLVLRVGKKGDKVWEVIVSTGPKRKRHRLGLFPTITVKDARRLAEAKKQERVSIGAPAGVVTVSDLFGKFRDAQAENRRAWRDVESVWANWAKERIGHIRLTDISFHHGRELREEVAKKSSQLRGAAVIRYIRPMFSWAENEGLIEMNPWAGLKAGSTALSRDRVLSLTEWAAVWDASFSEPYPFGPFIRVLMISAQRLSNVATMRWDEIEDGIWTIPREKMKATKPEKAVAHEVPLSTALKELIGEQPKIGPYVFTTMGDRPIRPGSKVKNRIQKISETSAWRLHDLRRTAATLMATAGVSRFIVERTLAHKDNTVTAVYDRSTYRDEKREALEMLTSAIDRQI